MSKNGKRRKHTIVDKNDILECQSLIWKVIRDKYLDNEGGVYINNIGYLCHKINPNRKIYLNKLTGTINRRGTGGYSYVHTCIDFMPRNKYFHLYISPALNKECRLAMESGRRYKFCTGKLNRRVRYLELNGFISCRSFVIQLAREGRLDFFVSMIQIHIFVQKT